MGHITTHSHLQAIQFLVTYSPRWHVFGLWEEVVELKQREKTCKAYLGIQNHYRIPASYMLKYYCLISYLVSQDRLKHTCDAEPSVMAEWKQNQFAKWLWCYFIFKACE